MSTRPVTNPPAPTVETPGSRAGARSTPRHGWSVDVEDWFHILDCEGAPVPSRWAELPSRVERNTLRMLDLLDRHGVRGTFFVLGWVAERFPDLVRAVAERGHEVGSHGHAHELVGRLGPDGFARDLDASLEALAKALGRDVTAFRAPGFSISPSETWAFPILASRGITLDASLFLTRRAHGGFPLDRSGPFDVVLPDGRTLVEVPVVPLRLFGRELAFSGGGYLRLLPVRVLEQSFRTFEARDRGAVAYLHPRELDPDQPRMDLPARRRFKYYVGLDTVAGKLDHLFRHHRFAPLSELAPRDAGRLDRPLHLAELEVERRGRR